MKIRKIKLDNYKIFKNLELDFTDENGKTLDFIIFTGINGTGKTTLLELIVKILFKQEIFELVPNLKSLSIELELTEKELLILKKIYDDDHWLEDFFRLNKNIINVFYSIEAEGTDEKGNRRLDVFDIITHLQEFIKDNTLDFKLCYFPDNFNIKKERTAEKLKIADFDKFTIDLEKYFEQVITKYLFKNRNITAAEVINQQIDRINNRLKGINIISKLKDIEDNKLIFQNFSGKKLTINDLSAGEKQLFFQTIYLNTLELKNSILLFDEPEISLHPSWQKAICSIYNQTEENNQVFLATHSPHIIGSVPAKNVFLFKNENDKIVISQPKYSKGHSISYVLSEIMETDYRDTYINEIVNQYLKLISLGKQNSTEGQNLWTVIEQLDPNSEERQIINLSLRRYKSIGK